MSAYPLSALVGQEPLVEALLVNAVAPDVGGVLVRGQRGTAKSTAVRGLAPLLPPVQAAEGQAFAFAPGEAGPDGVVAADAIVAERPAPLVELPLGTTLDRLVGSVDLGQALAGSHAFEPGLLARAHQGILYVDEVNLLPDHLVDALLDAAASGVARVEREAVSVEHAARFLLVGTMNVEEGELRPQLLDRFGLGVEVVTPTDPAVRAEIVRRRLAFERDPVAFGEAWRADEAALAARIAEARGCLTSVRLPERELLRITGACAQLGVDGVRGDIVSARAARALAALDGVEEVGEEHVRRAAALALAHRRRRDPLDGHVASDEDVQRALDEPPDDPPPDGGGAGKRGANGGGPSRAGAESGAAGSAAAGAGNASAAGSGAGQAGAAGGGADEAGAAAGGAGGGGADEAAGDRAGEPRGARGARERTDAPAPARLPNGVLSLAGAGRGPVGRRARTAGAGAGAIDSRPARAGADDVAVVASLRSGQLREHVRSGREGVFLCLVVDASGSMGAQRRLARVKGALTALLRDAYARRDRVAVVAFRDEHAEVIVPPGAPLQSAAAALATLPTGGRTPLAAGLISAALLIRREQLRAPNRRSIAVVLTDGRVQDPDGAVLRAAAALGRAASAVEVVDTEDGAVRLGLARALATAAGARVHQLTSPAARRAA